MQSCVIWGPPFTFGLTVRSAKPTIEKYRSATHDASRQQHNKCQVLRNAQRSTPVIRDHLSVCSASSFRMEDKQLGRTPSLTDSLVSESKTKTANPIRTLDCPHAGKNLPRCNTNRFGQCLLHFSIPSLSRQQDKAITSISFVVFLPRTQPAAILIVLSVLAEPEELWR